MILIYSAFSIFYNAFRPGPFKFNGIPLRRVNQAYTIATSLKIDVAAANTNGIDDKFFAKVEKAEKNKEEFFGAEKKVSVVSFHYFNLIFFLLLVPFALFCVVLGNGVFGRQHTI